MAQQRKKKSRLFTIPSTSEGDLSERMMVGATPQSIGADLRAARLARGESTLDVAQQLRLRESYIEAIESGNFEALPGVTYAIGFLRSYARYLRLDADDLIQRFKEEVSDIAPSSDLAFFEPVSESRVPRGGLVVLAVFLAIAAYAGWYYLSTRDLTVADLVPAVPEQFSGLVGPGEKTESVPAPPAVTEQAVGEARELTPPGPNGGSESAVDEDGATPPPEPLAAGQDTASQGAAALRQGAAGPRQGAVGPGQGAAGQGAATVAPGAGSVETSPAIPAVPPVAGAPEAAARTDAGAAGTDGPRVYGEGNVGSRVTVRATGDSWIQVRAADDTLLMTRTLRSGDSYRVPNQSGLKLMTGNAGALEILVDGQMTPSIGALGAVKRNVALDPERLKVGTAPAN